MNGRVPVPNRYFGVFQDGSIKVRGIEARRRDSAPFITDTQLHLLEILAQAEDADHLKEVLPKAQAYARKQLHLLRKGSVPVEQLLVAQKLSKELTEYSSPSPAARAVRQMQAAGQCRAARAEGALPVHAGQTGRVRLGRAGRYPGPRTLDLPRYRSLFERAVRTVLDPIEQSVKGGLEAECLYLFPALAISV